MSEDYQGQPAACEWKSHSYPEGDQPCDCRVRLATVTEHNVVNDPSIGPPFCQECSNAIGEYVSWPCPAGKVFPIDRGEKPKLTTELHIPPGGFSPGGITGAGRIWMIPEPDPVNHPAHYTSHPSGIECIQVVEHMGFNVGNAMKYLWRADEKGNALEDLAKAEWYVKREIQRRQAASS